MDIVKRIGQVDLTNKLSPCQWEKEMDLEEWDFWRYQVNLRKLITQIKFSTHLKKWPSMINIQTSGPSTKAKSTM